MTQPFRPVVPPRARVRALAWPALLAAVTAAHAGRPLTTDDAATAPERTCQVESWLERAPGNARAWVLAPACGIAAGWELGADATHFRPRADVRAALGASLKWAPEGGQVDLPAGPLRFGAKAFAGAAREAGRGWRGTGGGVLGLATWEAGDAGAVHLNLGAAHDRQTRRSAGLLNLAVVWTPHPAALLFAEANANTRREAFGGTLRTVGARWWVRPERLGVDLTAGREAGQPGTTWSVGLGWYGLFGGE